MSLLATTPPPVRVWERSFALFRNIWKAAVVGSLVQPLLYLAGMGLGVGTLVDEGPGSADVLGGVSYFAFIAPALIAAAVMSVSAGDSLWPMSDGFMWSNAFRAMTATPLTPGQVATGMSLWHATRAVMTAGGVAVVLLLFDDTRTWGLLLAVPFGVLTGLAFALPITAWSASRTTLDSFPAIMRFGIIPMFLFGGVFYPVEQLPRVLEVAARLTPLWHGVELTRGVVLHTLGAVDAVVHVAVHVAYIAAGWIACQFTFRRRLCP